MSAPAQPADRLTAPSPCRCKKPLPWHLIDLHEPRSRVKFTHNCGCGRQWLAESPTTVTCDVAPPKGKKAAAAPAEKQRNVLSARSIAPGAPRIVVESGKAIGEVMPCRDGFVLVFADGQSGPVRETVEEAAGVPMPVTKATRDAWRRSLDGVVELPAHGQQALALLDALDAAEQERDQQKRAAEDAHARAHEANQAWRAALAERDELQANRQYFLEMATSANAMADRSVAREEAMAVDRDAARHGFCGQNDSSKPCLRGAVLCLVCEEFRRAGVALERAESAEAERDAARVRIQITAEQRADDWIAFVAGNRGCWESGQTRDAAIGKLAVSLGLVLP